MDVSRLNICSQDGQSLSSNTYVGFSQEELLPHPGWKGSVWSIYHQVDGWSSWGIMLCKGFNIGLCECWAGHLVVTSKLALVSGTPYFKAYAYLLFLSQWLSHSWTHQTRIRVTSDGGWLTLTGLVVMFSWLFSWLFIPWLVSDGH